MASSSNSVVNKIESVDGNGQPILLYDMQKELAGIKALFDALTLQNQKILACLAKTEEALGYVSGETTFAPEPTV